ncbi:MAG: hypothetical protein R3300_07695, partial [Candidatus Promineifilaceae bacterium]|nr:hypothetical protein [Candidatus Promineifilaceae bacterium]
MLGKRIAWLGITLLLIIGAVREGAAQVTRDGVAKENGPVVFLPTVMNRARHWEPAPPPARYQASPPLEVSELAPTLTEQELVLALNKIGFHTGIPCACEGLIDWMSQLDAAGVPFFLKSVDNAGPLWEAQELFFRQSNVSHTLVYRTSTRGRNDGYDYDVPDYSLPPAEAAADHWAAHIAVFPKELDPDLVWLETMNEVDKNRAEWLAQFAVETARLALRD